jgi:hypothetical protein
MEGDDSQATPTVLGKLEPEDYYFDGPYMVFTAAYLLKRGTCCGSGCRHCPYRGTDRDRNPPKSDQISS